MAAARKRRRIWLWSALGLLLAATGALALLPTLASSPPARRWLLARANRALRPGGLEVARFRFSWLGPTTLTGVALRDPEGRRVVVAPRVDWDRTLGQLLFDRPRYGTIRLDGATIDVVRGPGGSINIYEALKPILGPNPGDDLTLVVDGGKLTVGGEGLDGPLVMEPLSLRVRRAPKPAALTWTVLAGAVDGPSIALAGSFDRWKEGPPSASITVDAKDYPALALGGRGITVRGRPSGTSESSYEGGAWRSTGALSMSGVSIGGEILRGDDPRIGRLSASWKVDRGRAEALNVDAGPLGSLRVRQDGRLDGKVDLAAVAALIPRALRLREGLTVERGEAVVEAVPDGPRWTISGRVDDLAATIDGRAIAVRDPSTLTARIDGPRLESLALKTPFLDIRARGDLDAGIAAEGTVDLDGLGRRLAEYVDLKGTPPTGSARISATYRRRGERFEAHASADLAGPGPAIHADVNIEGADATWRGATLGVRAPGFGSLLSARRVEGGAEVDWHAKADLNGGYGVASMSAAWRGESLAIGGLRLELARAGDPAATLSVDATGAYDRAAGRLSLRDLGAASPLRLGADGLVVEGLGGPSPRATLNLVGDLARLDDLLAPWTGRDPLGLVGELTALATARATDAGPEFAAKVRAAGPDGPIAGLDLSGSYRAETGRLSLAEATLSGPLGIVEARGGYEHGVVDLKGRVAPAWDRVNALLREKVEPGATIAGAGRPFAVHGPLELARIEAEGGVDLASLDIYGLKLGPTPRPWPGAGASRRSGRSGRR